MELKGEDSNVEYKLFFSKDANKWLKTIVAFLNSGKGGKIYFGVDDKGNEKGLQYYAWEKRKTSNLNIDKIHFCDIANIEKCVDKTLIYIASKIKLMINPWLSNLYFSVKIHKKNPYIILIKIYPTKEIVYELKNTLGSESLVYERIGSQSILLRPKEIAILKNYRKNEIDFQLIPSQVDNLNFMQLREILKAHYHDYDKNPKFWKKFKEQKLTILKQKYLNYEAFLLSDENTTKIKINNFSKTETDAIPFGQSIIKNKCIFYYIFFLAKHLLFFTKDKIKDDLLLEIIYNIIIHNDYYHFGNNGPIIEIFDDHIQFLSYQKNALEKIQKRQSISWKYPNIVELFSYLNYQKRGNGISNIKKWYGEESISLDEISYLYIIYFKK
ncbi:unknown; predicted coding region [Mycoplasmopsis pulmonis]|uniref:Schlafen AlbA-2 domain-containing protein n=1 Tax=Mycoplasmopsis pulmonis (strain UAB CTIP) TaxID=272635 RepID=Q98R78_MYCPU|nr:ATP-binding protein [Mycoplasmopsis pulmonis]MDZ7293102.1 putative DNA binding domain-containing protein [Mycoplasmopsis pulmonis]CAC13305.1 unknown; predicted coding region [Mycoplasmopsis pulmonis]VEU67897.1 Divergent AAA domain [Mycoplasmopsis pulmonis]